MLFFFFDENGIIQTYDSKNNTCTLKLGDDFVVECDTIYFIEKDGEVIDYFLLYSYELLDDII